MKRELLGALIPLACLAGCDINDAARVRIEYDQLAIFGVIDDGGQVITPQEGDVFVLYRVLSIENTGFAAQSYLFEPDNVLTVAAATLNAQPSVTDQQAWLGGGWIGAIAVPAGGTDGASQGLGCFIKEATGAGLLSSAAMVDVLHTIDFAQPVSIGRAAGDQGTAALGDFPPVSEIASLCDNPVQ
ncbi:MAG: hypothetical protein AAF602_25030 [Myxococcota bacterium]